MSALLALKRLRNACAAGLLLCAATTHAQSDGPRVFKLVAPSVVTVLAFDEGGKPEGQGSGVIVEAGKVITNCHVVRDAQSLRVRNAKGEAPATWTTRDPSRDLCLLTVAGLEGAIARVRAYKELVVGERVFAVGNPLGFDLSVSEGLITGLAKVRDEPMIIANAALSPGSSGGGLFDAEGRLVGVTTAILGVGQNLNIVLPADGITELNTRGLAANPAPALPLAEPRWQDEAETLRAKSDWKALEPYARKWLAAHPSSSQAGYHLGIAVMQQGRKEEAEAILRSALKADERDATAWSYLAHILYESGKRDEAIKSLDRAIAIRGGESYFYALRAGFMRTERRLDEAKTDIERAIAYRPGLSGYWFTLGQIETARNQLKEAARAYRVALRLDPNYVLARQNLADVLARAGNTTQAREILGSNPATGAAGAAASEANTWLAVGNKELAAARFADAESAFRKVIALVPESHAAWWGLGVVFEQSSRIAEAEDAFSRTLKIKADFAAAHWGMGRVQERRGDQRAALASYKSATEYDSVNPSAWASLANLAQNMRDFRQSTIAYRRLVELGKAGAPEYVRLAEALVRSGQVDAGREAMQAAEKLAPDDLYTLHGIAMLAGMTGDYQRALEYSERAIAKAPAAENSWSSKGYSLLKLGRIPEAILALETAVGLNPKSINALINLGEAKVRNREFGPAIRVLERALEINPNALDARVYVAQAYLSVKQFAKTREHLQVVFQQSPNFPQALGLMTLTAVVEGKNDEALENFSRLKTADPKLAALVRKQAMSVSPAGATLPE